MREKGVRTQFIYAGYGYFDDMNYFFATTGSTSIDATDFTKRRRSRSRNVWGVCDEDLFLQNDFPRGGKIPRRRRPFFSMVMTTSNHRPFTYPEGKIDIPSHTGREGCEYGKSTPGLRHRPLPRTGGQRGVVHENTLRDRRGSFARAARGKRAPREEIRRSR